MTQNSKSKISRREALTRLGMTTAAAYTGLELVRIDKSARAMAAPSGCPIPGGTIPSGPIPSSCTFPP